MKIKNPNAVALGKKSAEVRKKKMGEFAFTKHMQKIASYSRSKKLQITSQQSQ